MRPAEAPRVGAVPRVGALQAAYRRVVQAYVPAPYSGRIVVLRSEHAPDSRPDLGWSTVGARVEVHEVPGDHLGTITRHIAETARRLRDCLERDASR
jgi:hypothetical protein